MPKLTIVMAGKKINDMYEYAIVHTGDAIKPYTLVLSYNPEKGTGTICRDFHTLDEAMVNWYDLYC